MNRGRALLVVTVLASVTALTGCTSVGPAPEPVMTASTEATVTPAPADPTVPAAAQDPADPATWIVSGTGIGPITIGSDVGEFATAGPYAEHDAQCPNPAVHRLAGDGLAPMTLVTDDGGNSVASAHVTSWGSDNMAVASPKTVEGIGLGANLADVQATYDGIELTSSSNDTPQYAYADGDGWVVFTMQDDLVVVLSASTTSSNPSELCG